MYKMDSKDKIVCGIICICGLFLLGNQISETSATSKLEKTLAAAKDLPNSVKPIENFAFNNQNIKIHRGTTSRKQKKTAANLKKNISPKHLKFDDLQRVKTFGIIIGKTTKKELIQKKAIVSSNKWFADRSYSVLHLNNQMFPIKNLNSKNVYAIINSDGVIEAFGLTIDSKPAKDTFHEINQTLKKKYSLVYKKIPFVGDLFAKYKKNNVNIILNSPRLNCKTFLTYATENILQIETNYLKQQEKTFSPHINEIL